MKFKGVDVRESRHAEAISSREAGADSAEGGQTGKQAANPGPGALQHWAWRREGDQEPSRQPLTEQPPGSWGSEGVGERSWRHLWNPRRDRRQEGQLGGCTD